MKVLSMDDRMIKFVGPLNEYINMRSRYISNLEKYIHMNGLKNVGMKLDSINTDIQKLTTFMSENHDNGKAFDQSLSALKINEIRPIIGNIEYLLVNDIFNDIFLQNIE